MKRFLVFLIIALPFALSAQTFNKAIGIRGGLSSGFEYRFYTDDANSYKLLLATRNSGIQLHALKEFHEYDLFEFSDQLSLFYGLGAHIGYEQWDKRYVQNNTTWYKKRTALLAGIDIVVGLEYLFYEVPLAVGFEVKPYIDVLGRDFLEVELFDFAFTLKYHF